MLFRSWTSIIGEGNYRTFCRDCSQTKTNSRTEWDKVHALPHWTAPGGRKPADWTGRRDRLGDNKGVFDAELYALHRALQTLELSERRQRYPIFSDLTAAISRTAADDTGLAWANRRQLPSVRPQWTSKAKETSSLSDEVEGNEAAISIPLHAARRAMAAAAF